MSFKDITRICKQCQEEFHSCKRTAFFCSKLCVINYVNTTKAAAANRKRPRLRQTDDERKAAMREWWRANPRSGWSAEKRDKQAAYSRQWKAKTYEQDKPKRYAYTRAWKAALRRSDPVFNALQNRCYQRRITLDQFHAMNESQDFQCAICADDSEILHIDHCHATGKVRGLLCIRCNTVLGKFADDPSRFQSASEYLLKTARKAQAQANG